MQREHTLHNSSVYLRSCLSQSNDRHQVVGDVDFQAPAKVPRLQNPCVVSAPTTQRVKVSSPVYHQSRPEAVRSRNETELQS